MNSHRSVLMVVVTMVVFGYGVVGDCDHRTIISIVKSWDSNIPTDVLKHSVGDLTYVYLSPFFISKDDPRVYCVATRLAQDQTTATDIYVYRDLVSKYTVTYNKVENSGKITMKVDGSFDESQFVISFKNHVMAFWQCIKDANLRTHPQVILMENNQNDKAGKFNNLVGIAVDVNHVKDAQADILEAKTALKFLGLNTGEDLTPCTPEILQNINTD